jgi:hypothetical protein
MEENATVLPDALPGSPPCFVSSLFVARLTSTSFTENRQGAAALLGYRRSRCLRLSMK